MVFSDVIFLFIFLPIVIILYFLVKQITFRNSVLLLFSLLFYSWGEPKYVLLMLFSIIINYFFGLFVEARSHSKHRRKLIVAFAIISNLLILGYFKYMGFIIDVLNDAFNLHIKFEEVPLPIGISFYTFQAMSYVIDIYRNEAKVQRNPLNLALYISLFPQLIAGPIVRYNLVSEQMSKRIHSFTQFGEGLKIFIIGLSKKVLIANQVGFLADVIFNSSPNEMSVSLAWIGIIAYTLQIYFDFSGYTDMAIGLGKMFGFDFPANFRYPYISTSISEFWRRWHITLGSWFRDYVYIPLGGNRVSKLKAYRNLFIVWSLTGLWHGASWTFIAWGLYYGLLITIEKAGLEKILSRLWKPLQHAYVILLVMIGWVFFRADNFGYSFDYLSAMFGLNDLPMLDNTTLLYLRDYWMIFSIAIIGCTPIIPYINKHVNEVSKNCFPFYLKEIVIAGIFLFLFIESTIHMVNSTYNPFIYFRF